MKSRVIDTFFLVVSCLFVGSYSFGQTVRHYPDSTYLYSRILYPHNKLFYDRSLGSDQLEYFSLQNDGEHLIPIKIRGVAIALFRDELADGKIRLYYNSTWYHKLKLKVYELVDYPKIRLVHEQIVYTQQLQPPDSYFCYPPNVDTFQYPLYEFYFDSALVLRNHFLITASLIEGGEEGRLHILGYAPKRINIGTSSRTCYFVPDSCYVSGFLGKAQGDTIFYRTYSNNHCDGLYPSYPLSSTPEQNAAFFDTARISDGQYFYPILTPRPPQLDSIPICSIPRNFRANYQSHDTVIFTWFRTGNGRYQLSMGLEDSNIDNNPLINFSDSVTFLRFTGLAPGRYKAAIRRVCTHFCDYHGLLNYESPWCDSIYFSVGDTLAINDLQAGNIHIYPNPAHNVVNVSSNQPIVSIEVCDISGRSIKSLSFNPMQQSVLLDVAHLNKGIYLLSVTTTISNVVQRLAVD